MNIKETRVSTILKQITKTDSLFKGNYTIDPYQNCSFNCIYCDSTYDDTIYVKLNTLELLEDELQHIEKKRIIIGSVHDPYQPLEETYKFTRSIINLLLRQGFPIHILTKSPLVLRDLDLLKTSANVHVTISFISPDQTIADQIEKQVPTVLSRYQIIKQLQERNVCCGGAIIPLLPGIIDQNIEQIIEELVTYNASYVLSEHLFLRGDQKNIFFSFIEKNYPSLLALYNTLFEESMTPSTDYTEQIDKKIEKICGTHKIPTELPL